MALFELMVWPRCGRVPRMSGSVRSSSRWWMSPAAHDLRHLQAFKTSLLETMAGWWRQHGDALPSGSAPGDLSAQSSRDLAEAILVHHADRFLKVAIPAASRPCVVLGMTDSW